MCRLKSAFLFCYSGCRRGSPSRQRRRARRAEARQSQSTEEVPISDREKDDTEEVLENQVDSADTESSNGRVEYELKVDAHVECKNFNVIGNRSQLRRSLG